MAGRARARARARRLRLRAPGPLTRPLPLRLCGRLFAPLPPLHPEQETQTRPEGQIHFFPIIFNGRQLYDVMAERCGPSVGSGKKE